MRRLLIPSLLVTGILVLGGCGGDDDGSGDGGDSASDAGGELFTQSTQRGTLAPIAGREDAFKLTFTEPAPNVTVFTDRPARSASTEPLANFVDQWDQRGFGQDPPNAALVIDQEPDDADTAVFTLADPSYDQASGFVSYTATHISGGTSSLPSDEDIDPPPSFGDAHLFIDPSGAADVHDLAVSVLNNEHPRDQVTITFNPPWVVYLASDDQEISYLVGPNAGGGSVRPSTVTLGPGGLEFQVQGGAGAITGTASFKSGNDVSIQVDDNPAQTIKSGNFSLTP